MNSEPSSAGSQGPPDSSARRGDRNEYGLRRSGCSSSSETTSKGRSGAVTLCREPSGASTPSSSAGQRNGPVERARARKR